MEKAIDISSIENSPRYVYTAEYIFTGKYSSVAAFEKKDYETGFHVQEFYELCLISRGEGYHIIEDTVVRAVRGDVFIVPPGQKHAFIGGSGFNVYFIHLSPDFLLENSPRLKNLPTFFALFEIEPLMRANGKTYRHLYLNECVLNEIFPILDTVSKGWQSNPSSKLVQESYIIIVLTKLCSEYEKLQMTVGKNAHNDRLFMESISMILHSSNEKLTIESLAQVAGLSRTAYIKRFRETMGMPPRHFIMKRRLSEAKKLLIETDKPISKIAEETGFYDTAHFSKCFTMSEGISPTDYRRK